MAKSRPKTAEELCTLIESLLSALPEAQRKRFWQLITEHRDNWHHRYHSQDFARRAGAVAKRLMEGVIDQNKIVEEQHQQLKKHRRPPENTKRDAEIVKLKAEGMTAGEIVLAMRARYPKLTDKTVNRVLSTTRNRPPEAD